MPSVTIKIRADSLDNGGRRLLSMIRQQNRHLAALLSLRSGIIYAEVSHAAADDILRVVVDDVRGPAEQVCHFGRDGQHGAPAQTLTTRRVWLLPEALLRHAAAQPDEGAQIINLAAAALRDWCAEEGCAPWRDPDWITQSAAANLVGVPDSTIAGAVHTGKLATWDDPDEANPQRRTRVRQSDVLTRWARANATAI
jgi:hypothetical protein